ncbi:hypothetical protein [Flavobacterium capsici]|uniref:Uncharacterized protein n=1 Tax=Flavobacterium capsici TaxID=3075618 RepID=A0AA96F0C7_9FLAO|nr:MULTISPECIES: hypothetical protein [unclassified Flavobacterium]WNM19199.1 hypothetical protein RN608_00610 [Flavobacterium sp. PMR2A8]WNM20588.1 hypothetical protein RN605_07780 [Flavobacterium sp. PMTSA4]
MEPNNMENQIKEKLNSREIQPSAQAWDRLDAMLTVAEEKKTKRFPFWFIGVAASVLVLLTVGLFIYNQGKSISIPNNEIVVAPENQEPKINNELPITEQNQVATSDSNQSKSIKINQNQSINNQGVSINNQKNNQNSIINRDKEIEYLVAGDVAAVKDIPKVSSTEPIVVPPRKEIVQKKSTYVDVDALLASAENSSKSQIKSKSEKIKVDANTLLSHADGEVEQTFREKVINRISKNYQEVKTALANRNQE